MHGTRALTFLIFSVALCIVAKNWTYSVIHACIYMCVFIQLVHVCVQHNFRFVFIRIFVVIDLIMLAMIRYGV